jgi:RNA polymerase sigma-70 factor (ECF subfamily)
MMVPGPAALEEMAEDAEPPSGPRDPEGIAAHGPYLRLIRGILVAKKVPHNDVEDVQQDVVIDVLRAVASPVPIRSMRKLITRISHATAANHFRRAALRRCLPFDDALEGGAAPASQRTFPEPDRALEERERAAALPLLLEKLEPELRDVFLLIDIEQKTAAEAAQVLGLKESTVRWRRDRARARFEVLVRQVRAESERLGPPATAKEGK